MATEQQNQHGKVKESYFLKDEFWNHDGKWGWLYSSLRAEGGLFYYWEGVRIRAGCQRALEGAGAAEQLVGAEQRSKAAVQVWASGLEVRSCLVQQQQGFWIPSATEGLKKVSDTGGMCSSSFSILCHSCGRKWNWQQTQTISMSSVASRTCYGKLLQTTKLMWADYSRHILIIVQLSNNTHRGARKP